MDLAFTAEQQAARELAAEFVDREIIPHAAEWDRREQVDPAHRETLRALIEARQTSLLADALGAGERVYAEKPKAFRRRLRAYWRAWRRPVRDR